MISGQSYSSNVILVVDDDADSVAALERVFTEAFGCGVLTASSGDEALRIVESGVHIDLVFADVVMPDMDGVTLAHLISRRFASLPVVLATGRTDVVDSVTERGGIALLKPYSLERLEAVLAENLSVDARAPASDVKVNSA